MTKYLGSFPDLGGGGSRLLHPAAEGVALTLSGGLTVTGGNVSITGGGDISVDDITADDATFDDVTIDELILTLLKLGTNPAATGLIRMANNQLVRARNAANNADLDVIGTNSSNGLLLGSGLTGLVKVVSSVVSAATLVNADVSASAAIDWSKLASYTDTTYTPNLRGATTPGTHTYSQTVGQYIRLGGLVVVFFNVTMTAKDGAMAGDTFITLPLTSRNTTNLYGGAFLINYGNVDFAAGYTHLTAYIPHNDNRLVLSQQGDNVAAANVATAAIANTTFLRGIAVYCV